MKRETKRFIFVTIDDKKITRKESYMLITENGEVFYYQHRWSLENKIINLVRQHRKFKVFLREVIETPLSVDLSKRVSIVDQRSCEVRDFDRRFRSLFPVDED